MLVLWKLAGDAKFQCVSIFTPSAGVASVSKIHPPVIGFPELVSI